MAMSLPARPHTYTLSHTKPHTFPLCVLSVGCLLTINNKSHLLVKLCRGLSSLEMYNTDICDHVLLGFDLYSWDITNTSLFDQNVVFRRLVIWT